MELLKDQFFDACFNGDMKFVQERVTTGQLTELMKQRDLPIFQSKTGFLRACEGGMTEVVKLLVSHGADLNEVDSCQRTGLHLACRKGKVDVIRFLVTVGANQLARDKDGWTPLHSACYEGQVQAVRELLLAGRKSFTCDEDTLTNTLKLTPECVSNTNFFTASTPSNGNGDDNPNTTNPNTQSNTTDNATPNAAVTSDETDAPAPNPTPLVYTVNPTNIKNNVGESPLHIACTFAEMEVVMELISHPNSDVVLNQQDNQGWTALHRSCSKGLLSVVQFLVDRGADANLKTIFGSTCWDVAKAETMEEFKTSFFEGSKQRLTSCRHA